MCRIDSWTKRDIECSLEDFSAAVDFLSARPDVDAERIALLRRRCIQTPVR